MSVAANMYDCQSGTDNATFTCIYRDIMLDLVSNIVFGMESLPWVGAVAGSILVGLSGVLPLLIIKIDQTDNLKQGDNANFLKTLLSFAVGGLLGDVFLHALPEIWANDVAKYGGNQPSMYSGLLILCGLIVFVIIEKIFSVINPESQLDVEPTIEKINNNTKGYHPTESEKTDIDANNSKHITGYLNLVANMIDNFAHGLSLGGAFLVSGKTGCFTTMAILIHEIPHEVGDFAILLKSGFSKWDAAKFQIVTAGGGLIGAMAALMFSGASNSMEARTSWILPFTAGSFLHIALVTVLPDLLKEESPKESFKQVTALLLGIFVMAAASTFGE